MMNRSAEIVHRLSSQKSLGITGVYLPGQDRDDVTLADIMLSSSQSSTGIVGPGLSLPIQFGSSPPDPTQETKHLKGLFLANIDLVQHQQEILIAKDRTIHSLRQENETMKNRLERIERRMSLAHHKLPKQTPPTTTTNSSICPVTEIRNSAKRNISQVHTSTPLAEEGVVSQTTARSTGGVRKRLKMTIKTERRELHREMLEDLRGSSRDVVNNQSAQAAISTPVHTIKDLLNSTKPPSSKRLRPNSEILTTDIYYYVQPPPAVTDDLLDEDEDDVDAINVNKKPVQVPSWRTNIVHGKYVIEGTENLDDHVFIKRHQKSENEEKRRKRWDVQRHRDLQLLRKHQLKDDSETCSKSPVITFLPDLEKALYIEVSDSIPVSAFGYPLPNVIHREFSLPWYVAEKPATTTDKASKKTAKMKRLI